MSSLKKKKVLVAGGAGFLGVNLCQNLLLSGHNVICLDNFSSGSKKTCLSFTDSRDFRFVRKMFVIP